MLRAGPDEPQPLDISTLLYGNRFNRTAVRAPLFNYLAPSESAGEKMVSLTFLSWNRIGELLSRD